MVSIIIPVFNAQKYLEQCLSSILMQTYRNFEVIIVDDGSTDSSGEICREWQKRDNRIKLLSQKNAGQGIARNRAVKEAKGEYLAFLDADDWWEADFLEKMVERILLTGADMVFCDTRLVIDLYGETIRTELLTQQIDIRDTISVWEEPSVLYKITGVLWDKLWRRELFSHVKMPGYAFEDEEAVLKILSGGYRIAQIHSDLYNYRIHFGSTVYSRSCLDGLEKAFLQVKEFMREGPEYVRLYPMLRIRVLYSYQNVLKNIFEKEIGYDKNQDIQGSDAEENLLSIEKANKRAYEYIDTYFPESRTVLKKDVFLLGSYNLRACVKRRYGSCDNYLHDYSYSALPALLSKHTLPSFETGRKYNDRMISREWGNVLEEELEALRPAAIIMDLLEETYGVIKFDDEYYTNAPGVQRYFNMKEAEAINFAFESEEYQNMWKAALDRAMCLFKSTGCRVILMENYLSQQTFPLGDYRPDHIEEAVIYRGIMMRSDIWKWIARKRSAEWLYRKDFLEKMEFYPDAEAIGRKNELLYGMYCYVHEKYPWVEWINIDAKYTFTDAYFEFGVLPVHYNEWYYQQMADKIVSILETGEGL